MRKRPATAFRRIGTVVVEASEPPPELDFAAADEWRCLVTHQGVPCAYVAVPSPGTCTDPAVSQAALLRHAAAHVREKAVRDELRRRLGGRIIPANTVTCSVVVCTHRRPDFLPATLESLGRLDPAPHEIIVVDNDPGAEDCREVVRRAGARYIRENRRGLNRARATGFAAASGEIVAFADDDCIMPPGWLRAVPELFADATVAACTGPGFAHEIETAHQLYREETAGFVKELRRRTFDWSNVWLVHSGQIGTGANMLFRRATVHDPEALFSPELDAGTRTRSGGDLYALFRVLAAGHRITYDPAIWFLHRHRPDRASLESTIEGYGIGLSAFLSKALVEDRELASFAVWWWLWRSYARAVLGSWSGYGDPELVALRWAYLRAGWLGLPAWLRERREAELSPSVARQEPPHSHQSPPSKPAGNVSVVVASTGGPRLERCLSALEEQAPGEIVVASPRRPSRPGVRWVANAGRGGAALEAGVAASTRELVLLLDDSLIPQPGLVSAHSSAHGDSVRPRLVIGYSQPVGSARSLADAIERLEGEDRFRLIREAAVLTCAAVDARNISISRGQLERLGGIEAAFGPAAAGRDLGIRALEAGLELVHSGDAVAGAELRHTTRSLIGEAYARGREAAELVTRHPGAAVALPEPPAATGTPGAFATWLFGSAGVRAVALPALELLERLRLRRSWGRLASAMRRAAYRAGLRAVSPHGLTAPAVVAVDLLDDGPIPPSGPCPPLVDVRMGGRRMALVTPPDGHWHHEMFEEALSDIRGEDIGRIPAAANSAHRRTDAGGDTNEVTFVRSSASAGSWASVDRQIRAAATELVAVCLPGVQAQPACAEEVRTALAGPRVAVAVACGLHQHEPPGPLVFLSRRLRHGPYAPGGRPAQLVAVRRSRYVELGGFGLGTARLGPHGPVLDFVERVLAAGMVVGYWETPAIRPPGAHRPRRSRNEFRAWVARGGLLARDAGALGLFPGTLWLATRALLPRARQLGLAAKTGEPSVRHWVGSTGALLWGLILAGVHCKRRRDTPRPRSV